MCVQGIPMACPHSIYWCMFRRAVAVFPQAAFWYNRIVRIKEEKPMGKTVEELLTEWEKTRSISVAADICDALLKEKE